MRHEQYGSNETVIHKLIDSFVCFLQSFSFSEQFYQRRPWKIWRRQRLRYSPLSWWLAPSAHPVQVRLRLILFIASALVECNVKWTALASLLDLHLSQAHWTQSSSTVTISCGRLSDHRTERWPVAKSGCVNSKKLLCNKTKINLELN